VKSTRIYWTAGALLATGILLFAVGVTAGTPSFVTSVRADDGYPKHSPTPKHSATPEDTATPKHSATPEDTATPKHSPTPEDTATVVVTATPRPSTTPSPTREPEPESDPTRTPVPPTATPEPPTVTPTLVREELPVVHLPPPSGSGGLLAEHRTGVAVLGFVLALLGVGLIVARGRVDARNA
jgi:hypothetical protein